MAVSDLPEKYLLEENQLHEDISTLQENSLLNEGSDENGVTIPEMVGMFSADTELDFKEMINDFETKLIVNALRATEGNKKEAARLLKLKRTTLLEKIKKKNLGPENW